jgi:hypothetical protein
MMTMNDDNEISHAIVFSVSIFLQLKRGEVHASCIDDDHVTAVAGVDVALAS